MVSANPSLVTASNMLQWSVLAVFIKSYIRLDKYREH